MERRTATRRRAAHYGTAMSTRGTTLLEVLVSLALGTLVAMTTFGVARATLGAARQHDSASSRQQSASAALDLMVRDIQLAGYGIDAPPIRVAEAALIELQSDWNGDGDNDDSNERVRYAFNPSRQTLTRASGAGTPQPLLRDVQPGGLRLTYFAGGGIPLSTPGTGDLARIARVKIEVSLLAGGEEVTWQRQATLRRP